MKQIFLLTILLITLPFTNFSQSKKALSISLSGFDTYYHTTNDNAFLGTSLRHGDGFSFSFHIDDSAGKKPSTKIDLFLYSIDNYHKNVLSNNQMLNVGDDILMLSYLFKILKFQKGYLSTDINLGIGISTLVGRQYYDEYSNDLGYNNSFLKDDVKFGKHFGLNTILEADFKLRVMKKLFINGGVRFFGSPTGQLSNSKNLTYIGYTGNGIGFSYGFSYKF